MATMLNGAAVMDAALLLIAGNESCPQPQTSEHLAAVEIMKLKNIIILQNKIDLVKDKEAASQYEEILAFIRGDRCFLFVSFLLHRMQLFFWQFCSVFFHMLV